MAMSEVDYLNLGSNTLAGTYLETCRTLVDNNAGGYFTLYGNGKKTYSTNTVSGRLIRVTYAGGYYKFTILKKCRIIIMDGATSTIETDEIKNVNDVFSFQASNWKEIIAMDTE